LVANCAGCSGDFLPPTPPAEKATAHQDLLTVEGQHAFGLFPPPTLRERRHRGLARWRVMPVDCGCVGKSPLHWRCCK
jgi:hypothetical protein